MIYVIHMYMMIFLLNMHVISIIIHKGTLIIQHILYLGHGKNVCSIYGVGRNTSPFMLYMRMHIELQP